MTAVSELEILKKLEASKKANEAGWPEFALYGVKVFNQASREPFNLLSAYNGDPAYIEGVLDEADSEQADRYKVRGFGEQKICLENVSVYSYGDDGDDNIVFWAAGQAGWFRLQTIDDDFQPIYLQMEDATCLLHYLSDKVKQQRRQFPKTTPWKDINEHMRLIFRSLKKSTKFRNAEALTAEECYRIFRQYRCFLIKCMLENAEGTSWKTAPYLRWYQHEYPSDFEFLEKVVRRKATGSIPIPLTEELEEDELVSDGRPMKSKGIKTEPDHDDDTDVVMDDSSSDRPDPVRTKVKSENKARVIKPSKSVAKPAPPPAREMRMNMVTRRQAAALAGDEQTDRSRKKHKRKSILRLKGAGKTPTKSRQDALRVYRDPDMKDARENTMEIDHVDITPETSEDEKKTGNEDEGGQDGQASGSEAEDSDMKDSENEGEQAALQPNREYYEPKGPDDTWTCPYDGCDHKVWDAKSSLGVSLIQQHYAREHKDSLEELIKSEEKPWAKVSHLLAKVQAWRAQKSPDLPRPISNRRY